MNKPLLGCIADDYTGATDLSSMLVRAGMRVIQCFGIPAKADFTTDVDAIVVSLKSRSIPAADAVRLSLDALRFLQSQGIDRFFFKICSTFDSTAAGNIGPVADALADELHVNAVVFCPSFPENGRTVYCGHLFVGGVPLHESSMRNHPLNPMTDSNLVRVLQAQSVRPVDRLARGAVATDAKVCHWIADAIDEDDLRSVAVRAQEHRLLTGGSAIARYWAEVLMTNSHYGDRFETMIGLNAASKVIEGERNHTVVLAGSCSEATRSQIAEFSRHYPVHHLDLTYDDVSQSVDRALKWCDQQWKTSENANSPLLICSSANPESVVGARRRWGEQESATRVEEMFAGVAQGLIERKARRLIVAGGETSGAVINALRIEAVNIGDEITPGVPWVETTSSPKLALALKSGNFGGPRFFLDAIECAP